MKTTQKGSSGKAPRPERRTPSMGTAAAQASHAPVVGPLGGLKVRATRMGYFGLKRRREGDVFTLDNVGQFSRRWMEWVNPRTRERITTSPEALKRRQDEIKALKDSAPGALVPPDAPTGAENIFEDEDEAV